MYFEDSPSTWYEAQQGDLVYSSIDLWKGCISVVPEQFNGALVTKEFPIYEMLTDESFLNFLLFCCEAGISYGNAVYHIAKGDISFFCEGSNLYAKTQKYLFRRP